MFSNLDFEVHPGNNLTSIFNCFVNFQISVSQFHVPSHLIYIKQNFVFQNNFNFVMNCVKQVLVYFMSHERF